MGEFIEFSWEIEDLVPSLRLSRARRKLLTNLKAVYCIGSVTEAQLMSRGIKTLRDLRHTLRFSTSASRMLQWIKERNYEKLRENEHVRDLDLGFCFKQEELLFLDIETLGLYDSAITMLGVGFFDDNDFSVHVLFARSLEEEIAMCHHLKDDLLPEFKALVSYNGKSFDIPCIANRMLYYFGENPFISEDDTPYEDVNTLYHHIDLLHECRRTFKEQYAQYTLTHMEEKLLKWTRENEIESRLMGTCYRKYQKNPKRYVGLMKEAIEHNYYDIYSLPLILQKVLES